MHSSGRGKVLVVEHSGWGLGGRGQSWAYWHDFCMFDSSHSGLITANSKGLAGAGSVHGGVTVKKRKRTSSPTPGRLLNSYF